MWSLNCGCKETPQPFEVEIPILTYKNNSNITFDIPICNPEKDYLKEKIIQDFLNIVDKLECGIQPDLENLMEEISLIEMKKDWNLGIVRKKEDCSLPAIAAYSGWANRTEEIHIEEKNRITIENNMFSTAVGEGLIVWFAIPSTKSIDSAENTRFSGDFIQDNLVQIENQKVNDIDYKIYYYEFLGLPSDNRYNIILKN